MSTLAFHPGERDEQLRAVREPALMASLFVVYRQVRFLTRDDTTAARTSARGVVDFERSLGVCSEHAIQDAACTPRR